MELQITWFVLWGVLWAVYFMLDGFVLGAGMLHRFLGRNEGERRVIINTFGPVWDGNEVWLITAGGATFAAFPTTYALMFSYLYTALLLLLLEGDRWKGAWDTAILVCSFLPALLFGVAFGNIFRGLPMDASGYQGSFLSLLNPFGLITGALFVLLFLVHGALYLSAKTEGDLSRRALSAANRFWPALLVTAALFLVAAYPATRLYDNYLRVPVLLAVPLLAVASLVSIRVFSAKNKVLASFAASCATIVLVVVTGITGLFPNLIPSSIDPAYSLTIFNSSSSQYTLKIMTVVALIFVPIVIAYKIWVYRIFREKVTEAEVMGDEQAY